MRAARQRVLGFVDDLAHEVACGDERVDRTHALTGRVALLVGVDGGLLVAPEVQCVRRHRLAHLLGELAQLLGVLLDVLSPCVAQRAQRLAREAAADNRVVLVRAEQRVLVTRDGARFGRRDETGPEPHTVGAERDRGREPATVEDPAGGHDRNALADRVDDLRDERHRRHRPGVPAGFGALPR